METPPTTHQKALRINQEGDSFGTFAEIGAGQEVARWFFKVGKASATVAKSISAYDMTVSDEIYGHVSHYVSRQRLTAMLDYEYSLLLKRLDEKRGATTRFFAFAETVTTHSRPHQAGGHGWLGIRFQWQPRSEPSDIILHVQLLDAVTAYEQEAIGNLGVNLIYGAFYDHEQPEKLIAALVDNIERNRIEIDLIRFSGPAFTGTDNRLMSLQLIELGLTTTALFNPNGEVMQPAEVLAGKPVLIERGSFRPITNVTLEMIDSALGQLQNDTSIPSEDCVVLMEMTLHNLMNGESIDYRDFLARVDVLRALGKTVMISSHTRFDEVVGYLRQYTDQWIVMAVGMPVLAEIFNEKYYAGLGGGILEGIGRLFRGSVKLYVYPRKARADGHVVSSESLQVAPKVRHLYEYLSENGFIEPIREFHDGQLHISPREVLKEIQSGDPAWEELVPAEVAHLIKSRGLFGYRAPA
ncbi:MAG: TonB-dependent receptor [Bryobacteraceae bacterium]